MNEQKLQQFYNHLEKNPDQLAKAKSFKGDMTALAVYARELGYEVTAEELTAFTNKTKQALEAKWKELNTSKESISDGAKQFMEFSKLADTDGEVAKQITEASKSPQDLIVYGKEKGFTFDTKDMEEVAKKLMEQKDELSDDELADVAGGTIVGFAISVLVVGAIVGFGVGAIVGSALTAGKYTPGDNK